MSNTKKQQSKLFPQQPLVYTIQTDDYDDDDDYENGSQTMTNNGKCP